MNGKKARELRKAIYNGNITPTEYRWTAATKDGVPFLLHRHATGLRAVYKKAKKLYREAKKNGGKIINQKRG